MEKEIENIGKLIELRRYCDTISRIRKYNEPEPNLTYLRLVNLMSQTPGVERLRRECIAKDQAWDYRLDFGECDSANGTHWLETQQCYLGSKSNMAPEEVDALSVEDFAVLLLDDLPKRTADCPTEVGITLNARMIDKLSTHPESYDWSVRNWADFLDCSQSAVHHQPAWGAIMAKREADKSRYR